MVPEIIQATDPIMTRRWFVHVIENPTKALFVSDSEGGITGVVLAELRTSEDPIFRPRRCVHVNEIAVTQSHRSREIGRQIMERVHQWARELGISDVELQVWERNEPAIAFYQTIGYQPWPRTMRRVIDDQD